MEYLEITKDLWSYLKEAKRPLVIYGTGDGADKIINELENRSLGDLVRGIFASPGFVREGRVFRGFEVESFESICARLSDFIVLVAFGSPLPDVLSYVYSIEEKYELYAPDVPVCGGEVFDMEFVQRNEERLEKVYSRLADDASRKCFRSLVNYKLSGRLDYLRACEVTPDEADSLLGPFSKNTSFIDLGAYRGDTLLRFTGMFPGFISATAVEPERHSFKKLTECASAFSIRVTCVNALISDECGKATLTDSRGRGTRAAKVNTGREIDKVTVDSFEDSANAGFIKFDVEGSELAAIEGARNTISRLKPQMKIACYHKSADLFEIPEKVFEIRDDYRIYMRHTPCIPGWDVDYYFL
ncbi:MAG: FkbM family methyltransferase [Ruminococcaceae bacterium]|nr:FkbM family methyltransferase [Oscillospiraceae bacterium]